MEEELARVEQVFFSNIQLSNGTYKTTSDHRLDDVNELVTRLLPRRASDLKLMDVAVSSGISTAEWSDHLLAHGISHQMVAGDLVPDAILLVVGGRLAVLWQPDGEPLVVQFGSRSLYVDRTRRGDAIARAPLRWLLAALMLMHRRPLACLQPTRRTALARVDLVSRRVLGRSNLHLVHDDIGRLGEFVGEMHACRAANVLNRDYFADDDIRAMARVLRARLRQDGLLIVGRTVEVGGVQKNRATVFRRTDERMEVVARLNDGSDVEDLLMENPLP